MRVSEYTLNRGWVGIGWWVSGLLQGACNNTTPPTNISLLSHCEDTLLYRYPSVGLPMMHVLVVTHLIGCVEIGCIAALFLSLHDGDCTRGSYLALIPLVSHLRYASVSAKTLYYCDGTALEGR